MEKVEIFQPMKDETEIKNYMTKKKKQKTIQQLTSQNGH